MHILGNMGTSKETNVPVRRATSLHMWTALILLLPMATLASHAATPEGEMMKVPSQQFLVSTWTKSNAQQIAQSGLVPSQGVYRLRMNPDGTLLPLDVIRMTNPSWLILNRNHRFAFIANEDNPGRVSALRLNKDASPSIINSVASGGDEPTHITLTPDERYLLAAHYASKSTRAGISALPIHADGSLGKVTQFVPFLHGSNAVKDRQANGHAHSVNMTPDGRWLIVPDLGADIARVYSYAPDAQQPFIYQPQLDIHFPPGSGPRYMAFSKNGRYAYLVTELSATVYAYHITPSGLSLYQQINVSAKPDDPDLRGCGDIRISPDGRFMYVTNRRHANEIVIFSIDDRTGRLGFVSRIPSGGIEPRALAFDRTGRYLLVANLASNEVVEFRRDFHSGLLTPTGIAVHLGMPTDITFLP